MALLSSTITFNGVIDLVKTDENRYSVLFLPITGDSIETRRDRQRLAFRAGAGYDASMSIDVYSSSKPPTPSRAWASAFGLLIGVTALALTMSMGRVEGHLGALESSPDWRFSFRLPRGFVPLDVKIFPEGTIRRYKSVEGGVPLIFSIWSFEDAKNLTSPRACDLVLQASGDSLRNALIAEPATASKELVGGVLGHEVESWAQAMVVRALVADEYAVAFALKGREPNSVRRGYADFDLSCRSVQFARD